MIREIKSKYDIIFNIFIINFWIFFAVKMALPTYLMTKYEVLVNLLFIFVWAIRINKLEISFILYEYSLSIYLLPAIWKLILPIALVLIIYIPLIILSIRKINRNEFRSEITSKDGLKIAFLALFYIIIYSIMHFIFTVKEFIPISNFLYIPFLIISLIFMCFGIFYYFKKKKE